MNLWKANNKAVSTSGTCQSKTHCLVAALTDVFEFNADVIVGKGPLAVLMKLESALFPSLPREPKLLLRPLLLILQAIPSLPLEPKFSEANPFAW